MSTTKINLPDSIVDKLVSLPETGMGYQLVKVFLKGGTVLRKLKVLNSSILVVEGHPVSASEIERVELDA